MSCTVLKFLVLNSNVIYLHKLRARKSFGHLLQILNILIVMKCSVWCFLDWQFKPTQSQLITGAERRKSNQVMTKWQIPPEMCFLKQKHASALPTKTSIERPSWVTMDWPQLRTFSSTWLSSEERDRFQIQDVVTRYTLHVLSWYRIQVKTEPVVLVGQDHHDFSIWLWEGWRHCWCIS